MWRLWHKTQRIGLARQNVATAETADGAQTSQWLFSIAPQQLTGQAVDLMLSNSLVRYIVLPWQDFLWRRADWHALAMAQLQKTYGQMNTQADWQISLHLHRRNQSVLVSAIPAETMTYLNDLAKTQQFTWRAITPIGVHLYNQLSVARTTWLMMIEPMYVQLFVLDTAGRVQSTLSAYPIAGQEMEAAQRLMTQALILPDAHSAISPPKQVLVYAPPNMASGAFSQQNWPASSGVNTEIKWIQTNQGNQTHAQWLAKLKASAT